MTQPPVGVPRVATPDDAAAVARLLDAFNREYDTPTPGAAVLATRLERLLVREDVVALLAGDPAVAVALLTLRPNVWYGGPVALLDELYVAPHLRGRGLGSSLLAAAEDAIRRRGGEVLEINVDGDDVDARRFYERHGYANTEPGAREPLLYYHRNLRTPRNCVRRTVSSRVVVSGPPTAWRAGFAGAASSTRPFCSPTAGPSSAIRGSGRSPIRAG